MRVCVCVSVCARARVRMCMCTKFSYCQALQLCIYYVEIELVVLKEKMCLMKKRDHAEQVPRHLKVFNCFPRGPEFGSLHSCPVA